MIYLQSQITVCDINWKLIVMKENEKKNNKLTNNSY